MSKEEAKTMKKSDNQEEIVQVVPEEKVIDISQRVDVEATGTAPYHKEGAKFSVSPVLAEKMRANGWVK